MKKKMQTLEKQAAEIDEEVEMDESENGKAETDTAKIVGQPRRPTKKIVDDEEEEFQVIFLK